ncbi:MAG: HEPN domain-containing protein [Candidatus Hydrothermarchaeota archaeon]
MSRLVFSVKFSIRESILSKNFSQTNEARRWLNQAESVLRASKDSSSAKHYEWSCFQALHYAEKALKAFLFLKGVRGILTYSVRN